MIRVEEPNLAQNGMNLLVQDSSSHSLLQEKSLAYETTLFPGLPNPVFTAWERDSAMQIAK